MPSRIKCLQCTWAGALWDLVHTAFLIPSAVMISYCQQRSLCHHFTILKPLVVPGWVEARKGASWERRGEERKPDGELHWKWKTIGGGKEFLFFFLLLLIFRCYLHVMLDENVLWWLNTRLCTNTFTEPGFWLKHHSWDSLPSQQRLCGRKTSGFNLREVTEVKERNLWGGKECQQKDFFTAWTETSKLGKVEVTWSRSSNWSERSSTRRHSTGGR